MGQLNFPKEIPAKRQAPLAICGMCLDDVIKTPPNG